MDHDFSDFLSSVPDGDIYKQSPYEGTATLLCAFVHASASPVLGWVGGWWGGGVGWGGVGWGGIITSLARPHIRDATLLYALLHFIHIHTNLMLHVLHLQTDLMLRCKMSLALAHILDATL